MRGIHMLDRPAMFAPLRSGLVVTPLRNGVYLVDDATNSFELLH